MEIEQRVYDMMYEIISICNREIDRAAFYYLEADKRILKREFKETLRATKALTAKILMPMERYMQDVKQSIETTI